MEALASFLFRHRSQQPTQVGTWAALIGYLIIISSMVILIRSGFLQKILLALQQSAAFIASNSLGSTSGQAASSALTTSAFNPALYYYTAVIFLAIVTVSLGLFFGGLRTAYSWAREDLRQVKSSAAREEALGIVRRAAESLKATGEYRIVILRCYKQMCEMLSQNGLNIRLDETAREFSEKASSRLKLGSEAVRSLTFLFEEARYSAHNIEEEKRASALNELEILERALARANG